MRPIIIPSFGGISHVLVSDIVFQPPCYRNPTSKVNQRFRIRGELSNGLVPSMHSGKGKCQPSHQFKPKGCEAKDDKSIEIDYIGIVA
jgi:hypothetical protein